MEIMIDGKYLLRESLKFMVFISVFTASVYIIKPHLPIPNYEPLVIEREIKVSEEKSELEIALERMFLP